MRVEFYKSGKLHLTELIKSWNHFEILVNGLDEGRYKIVVYRPEGTAVRTISVKDQSVFTRASEAPIREVVES